MAKGGKSTTKGDEGGRHVIDVNKKARRDYEVIDTFEAGLELLGSEVKSIRSNGISLRDSYVRFKDRQLYLVGCHITPYKFSRQDAHEPYRDRRLLLHSREIARLSAQVQLKGLTIVPLLVYFNARGRCKLEIGTARGKKLHDKREDMKSRDAIREMERAIKR